MNRFRVLLPQGAEILRSQHTVTAMGIDNARHAMAWLFGHHSLTPLENDGVSLVLRSAAEKGVGIALLGYGAAVRIRVRRGGPRYAILQVPLSGQVAVAARNRVMHATRSSALLLPDGHDFMMRCDRGTVTLLLFVDRGRLRTIERVLRDEREPALVPHTAPDVALGSRLELGSAAGLSLLHALADHHDALDGTTPDGPHARWLTAELLLTRLLEFLSRPAGQPPSARRAEEQGPAARGEALVRRFEAVLAEGVEGGTRVVDIADQLSISMRTLQAHVREERGTTPSALVREYRLQHARALLSAADPLRETVTEIAQRAGFTHLGRFSVEYRQRYAESPTVTLRGRSGRH